MAFAALVVFVVVAAVAAALALLADALARRRKAEMPVNLINNNDAAARTTFLTRERQPVKLVHKAVLSADTRLLRFALPASAPLLGLPIGKHVRVYCKNPNHGNARSWNNHADAECARETIERNYSPTESGVGFFSIVIKVYGRCERFPDGGKMSQWLDRLSIGDDVDVAGPFGLVEYVGHGVFKKGGRDVKATSLALLAGGTGITPLMPIVEAIHATAAASGGVQRVSVVFANRTEADILFRARLDAIAAKDARFKVYHTLQTPPAAAAAAAAWKGGVGYMDEAMMRAQLPPPAHDAVVLLCGPPSMIAKCKPGLAALEYRKENIIEF